MLKYKHPESNFMYPEEGDFEEVYSGEGRTDLVDNDSISASEEAFMSGYDEQYREDESQDIDEDDLYENAFSKKRRRSKRKTESFDEEDLLNDVEMR